MAKQSINLGATGTGAGGDTVRTALSKVNSNFDELYIAALPGTAAQKQAARDSFGLGSAAQLQAQGSDNDSAIGKVVLTQGAGFASRAFFGSYYPQGSGANVDNAIAGEAALYNSLNGGVFPDSGQFWWVETQATYSGDAKIQRAYNYAADGITSGRHAFRVKPNSGGVWSAWCVAWHSGNLIKQANASDQTAGAVLTVGAFGLGGSGISPPNEDCNQISLAGCYGLKSATVNAFPGKNSGDVLLHVAYSASHSMQLGASQSGALYSRYKVGGVWLPWTKLVNQNSILGAVYQSGGAPTGAIIEIGSNANGKYVRFADGTQICTAMLSPAKPISTALGNVFASDDISWTFPAAFSSMTPIQAMPAWAGTWGGSPSSGTAGTASANFRMLSASSIASTPSVRVLAVGRWFD